VKVLANVSELEAPSRGVTVWSQLIPLRVSERCVSLRWKRFFSHLLTSEESVKSAGHGNSAANSLTPSLLLLKQHQEQNRVRPPRGPLPSLTAFQLSRETQRPAKQTSTPRAGGHGARTSIFLNPQVQGWSSDPPAFLEVHFRFAVSQLITARGV